MSLRHLLALSMLLWLARRAPAQEADLLSTHAERTAYAETGRYEEVRRLCEAFASRFPKQVRCFSFGKSAEGREMLVLAANMLGALSPEAAQAAKLPVTLIQGGIHAGEIDGKDAGFLVLRELLGKPGPDNPLNKQVLLFVPVFNVDGHERFQAWNRPHQRGPKEMGWRTTAQNVNLNRDYAKVDSPEMAAMLALVNAWDPLLYVDLHVTDGAKFQHDISVQIEPSNSGDPELRAIGRQYQATVVAHLNGTGSMALPFYPSLIENDNPASGFADSVPLPRFSTGYAPLRNRFGVLVETHSWKTYPVRVKATAETIRATLAQVAEHGQACRSAVRGADQRSAALAGKPVTLTYQTGKRAERIEFKGYAYTRTPSEVSGAWMTRYDESRPEIWNVPFFKDISPLLEVPAPKAGYLVPPAHADWMEKRLNQHGIRGRRIGADHRQVAVEQFHAATAVFASTSFEGHQGLTVTGGWRAAMADVPAGSLFVPIAQPKARLVMALLEPQAPDSYLAWGFFNNHFERKEYMENYVAEEVAVEMLKDPAVKQEFARRLQTDKAFADSSQKRLEFFARRHESWDDRYQVYPIQRTARDFSGD